jgi:hypothetical protein
MSTQTKFMEALDWRLLDHVTGSLVLTETEYQEFKRTGSVGHLAGVRVVEDAVAASFQDTHAIRDEAAYNAAREWVGLPALAAQETSE